MLLRNALLFLLLAPIAAWCTAAILFAGGFGPADRTRAAVASAFVLFSLLGLVKWRFERALVVIAFACLAITLWSWSIQASNLRDWAPDQKKLPTATIDGPLVTVRNIRNFEYRSADDWDESYYEATFDAREAEQAYFIVVPFSEDFPGLAHTMVSFRFEGERYLCVSVEIRKEKGEDYHPLRGLFKQYEVMYVAGDERDLIGVRAIHRGNDVYVHPGVARGEKVSEVFLDVVRRMNVLAEEPEFYDTLRNNCTTNLVVHWENVHGKALPMDYRLILPGYSDQLVHELGMIDTEFGYEETRERNRVNERVTAAIGREDFSSAIRGRAGG